MSSTNPVETSRAQAPAQETEEEKAARIAKENEDQSHSQKMDEIATLIEFDPKHVTAQSLREIILAVPDVRAAVVASAIRCLGSERLMYDGQSKKVKSVPDGATIMKAVAFLAAYSDGLPVQTTLNMNVNNNKELPMEEMLASSPALVDALQRQLDRAKAVQKGGTLKDAKPARETAGKP
jgi:hypothetical protein